MRIRCLLGVAFVTCLAATDGFGGQIPTGGPSCPEIGSTYRPNPEDPDRHAFYRLEIDELPPAEDPSRSSEIWHFRMFDRASGKKVSELRLIEGCPAGGLCVVGDPDRRTADPYSNVFSNVVRLTEAFREPDNSGAPRAIVLPDFSTRTWVFGDADVRPDYLTFAGRPRPPDMRADIIWIRVACGNR